MRPSGRRQAKESFIPPAPPTPVEFQQRHYTSRESDVSSRPSSVGMGPRPSIDLYKDRSYQKLVVSTINSFLCSQNFPVIFKTTSPSAKDIHETLKFLLSILELPTWKLEELPDLLKGLKYPFKVNKSILLSPAAPHQWPTLLALIHWLVQLAKFQIHLSSPPKQHHPLYHYTVDSFLHYIRCDDNAVEKLDKSFNEKLLHGKAAAEESLNAARSTVQNLQAELDRLRSQPPLMDALQKEKTMLEEDVIKFRKMIEELTSRIDQAERALADKEQQLQAKQQETDRLSQENQELARLVDAQTFNSRDVDRMKRELQAVQRDSAEAQLARNAWEDKSWDLDTSLSRTIKDLHTLAIDCNQALKRLKIGNGIHYQIHPTGTTPPQIMGIDHKFILKPALASFADDIKKTSMEKLEELISYQHMSAGIAVRLEAKRNQLATLLSRIDEMEAQQNMIKKETQEYTSKCSAEATKMLEDIQLADREIDIMEREAAEVLRTSELKLQEAIKQSEEEIQMRARNLFQLVDSVSKFKEHVGSKISEMSKTLSETATAVSDAYRGTCGDLDTEKL
ncbi:hypothetical protein VNO78_22859 [Psophocarpus tetragonolobus]|uniref:Kinetochore protein NDC80 n=1 Tax=Psophocarpus tetragonolobus TaxID=3891 RepID=A0AAN9S304_PSOTE